MTKVYLIACNQLEDCHIHIFVSGWRRFCGPAVKWILNITNTKLTTVPPDEIWEGGQVKKKVTFTWQGFLGLLFCRHLIDKKGA